MEGRNNMINSGRGWKIVVLFDTDAMASKGDHSYDDTGEINLYTKKDVQQILKESAIWKNISSVQVHFKDGEPFSYAYKFGFVIAGTIMDFFGTVSEKYLYPDEVKKEEAEMVPKKRLDFSKMYDEFEKRYNPYPVQMSRSDAFLHALKDNLISKDEYNQARAYYGSLWNYVGD